MKSALGRPSNKKQVPLNNFNGTGLIERLYFVA